MRDFLRRDRIKAECIWAECRFEPWSSFGWVLFNLLIFLKDATNFSRCSLQIVDFLFFILFLIKWRYPILICDDHYLILLDRIALLTFCEMSLKLNVLGKLQTFIAFICVWIFKFHILSSNVSWLEIVWRGRRSFRVFLFFICSFLDFSKHWNWHCRSKS